MVTASLWDKTIFLSDGATTSSSDLLQSKILVFTGKSLLRKERYINPNRVLFSQSGMCTGLVETNFVTFHRNRRGSQMLQTCSRIAILVSLTGGATHCRSCPCRFSLPLACRFRYNWSALWNYTLRSLGELKLVGRIRKLYSCWYKFTRSPDLGHWMHASVAYQELSFFSCSCERLERKSSHFQFLRWFYSSP